MYLFSLTADVQLRALLPPSAALSNSSQNINQDQSSDEDIFDDSDTDDESSKKQIPITNKKSLKSKSTGKSMGEDPNSGAMQIKRLLSTMFPSTNDVYGFHLGEPSAESLHCYEQYAKIARDACSFVPSQNQHDYYELSGSSHKSFSSSSSFEM